MTKLIYSPHAYGKIRINFVGPDVFYQPYFDSPIFPENLPEEWTKLWGYLPDATGTAIVIGEWGGFLKPGTKDKFWGERFLKYLMENEIGTFFFAFNPNSKDTAGLVLDDWIQPNENILNFLKPAKSTDVGKIKNLI